MITLHFDKIENYDSVKNEFYTYLPEKDFRFEHSLIAISKWESKYEKSFFEFDEQHNMSNAELVDYLCMMCMDKGFNKAYLDASAIMKLSEYMGKQHTATTITHKESNKQTRKQIMTSELIYAYMAVAQIPFKCETWNINRLMRTIECVGVLNQPKDTKRKKGGKKTAERFSKLNAQRLAKRNGRG